MGDECSPPCEQALCHWESNRGTYPDRPGSRSGEPPSRPSEASASRMAVALRCSSNPFVVQGRYPDAWYGAIIEPSSTNSVGRENWPPRLFFECGARGCPHLARTLQHLCSPARDAVRWMHSLPCGDSGRDVIAFLVRRQVSGLHTLLRTTAPGKSAATSGGIDCGLAAPPTPALLVQLDSSNSRLSKPTKTAA